jgi:hypothetical protein
MNRAAAAGVVAGIALLAAATQLFAFTIPHARCAQMTTCQQASSPCSGNGACEFCHSGTQLYTLCRNFGTGCNSTGNQACGPQYRGTCTGDPNDPNVVGLCSGPISYVQDSCYVPTCLMSP